MFPCTITFAVLAAFGIAGAAQAQEMPFCSETDGKIPVALEKPSGVYAILSSDPLSSPQGRIAFWREILKTCEKQKPGFIQNATGKAVLHEIDDARDELPATRGDVRRLREQISALQEKLSNGRHQ